MHTSAFKKFICEMKCNVGFLNVIDAVCCFSIPVSFGFFWDILENGFLGGGFVGGINAG